MPQGLRAGANTQFRGCRSQVTLGGGARETIYLQPPPHKPRRHCLSPGRLLRKLRSGKVGCKLPVSSSGERNHAFLEQEEATAVSTRPLEGHQLFQEGLSFRVMTLSSDRRGRGTSGDGRAHLRMHTRPVTGCRSRNKPSDLQPKGSYTPILAPARMQQAPSRAGDTHCASPASPRSRKQQGTQNRLMQCSHGWLWCHWQHAPPTLAAPGSGAQPNSSCLSFQQPFGGHSPACTLQLHPRTSAEEEEGWEPPGCLAEPPLCGAGAALAASVPAARRGPRAKTGITVQESNKHGFLQDYSTKAAAFN